MQSFKLEARLNCMETFWCRIFPIYLLGTDALLSFDDGRTVRAACASNHFLFAPWNRHNKNPLITYSNATNDNKLIVSENISKFKWCIDDEFSCAELALGGVCVCVCVDQNIDLISLCICIYNPIESNKKVKCTENNNNKRWAISRLFACTHDEFQIGLLQWKNVFALLMIFDGSLTDLRWWSEIAYFNGENWYNPCTHTVVAVHGGSSVPRCRMSRCHCNENRYKLCHTRHITYYSSC